MNTLTRKPKKTMCTPEAHHDIEEWEDEFEAMGETCRNGKPWDQCTCC